MRATGRGDTDNYIEGEEKGGGEGGGERGGGGGKGKGGGVGIREGGR